MGFERAGFAPCIPSLQWVVAQFLKISTQNGLPGPYYELTYWASPGMALKSPSFALGLAQVRSLPSLAVAFELVKSHPGLGPILHGPLWLGHFPILFTSGRWQARLEEIKSTAALPSIFSACRSSGWFCAPVVCRVRPSRRLRRLFESLQISLEALWTADPSADGGGLLRGPPGTPFRRLFFLDVGGKTAPACLGGEEKPRGRRSVGAGVPCVLINSRPAARVSRQPVFFPPWPTSVPSFPHLCRVSGLLPWAPSAPPTSLGLVLLPGPCSCWASRACWAD
ncbi:hypothetical protein AXF42_Ash019537 [Apostasia shenzhenica]|uniref:Uncharacterized protein n=1 Tax=Apostasia shenzhenica TaxID=1088818 RepID=A0A2I0A0D8_9ASPA|nr:hypothetical protein AXF42_Ash019537 [Apostasia shenzhenica]